MLSAWRILVGENNDPDLYRVLDGHSRLAKNLYNAALFRIRQVFFGYDKKDESRSDCEREVFAEIDKTLPVYPALRIKRVLSYKVLDKILRANENPDYFAGLPMQTAEAVVHQAVNDFLNWLKALKAYKKNPSGFTGKPRMPRYCKGIHKDFLYTNQETVLYRDDSLQQDARILKTPGIPRKRNLVIYGMPAAGVLKQLTVTPMYGKYMLSFILEDCAEPVYPDLPNMAGLDFGTDNIAALACTDGSSAVCKGGAVLSENRLFAKKRSEAVSAITTGHMHMHAQSRHLTHLSEKHYFWNLDTMHKTSHWVVLWCLTHGVGILVIGVNRFWQQNADMGKRNNQNFVSIPHAKLKAMIEYKALTAGITVIEQEESYTSRADVSAGDIMPVYGQTSQKPEFSGRRICRGLYQTHSGIMINADCNGAANILRKAFPNAWKNTTDFAFLARPYCMSYRKMVRAAY